MLVNKSLLAIMATLMLAEALPTPQAEPEQPEKREAEAGEDILMLIHIDTNNRITHGRELFRPALNNFALNGKVPSDNAMELYIPEIDQPDGPGDLASRKGRELYHSELNGDTNGKGRQLYPPTFDFTNRKGRELYPPTFDFTNRRGRELYPPGLD